MKTQRHVVLIFASLFTTSSAFGGGNVQYADPRAPDSPGYGASKQAPSVDQGAVTDYRNQVNNSGLYKDKIPTPATNGGDSISAGSGSSGGTGAESSGGSTYFNKYGEEVDTESGVLTGRVDPSKATAGTGSQSGVGAASADPADEKSPGGQKAAQGARSASNLPLVANIDSIAALVSSAAAAQAKLVVPGLPEMQEGKGIYAAKKPICNEQQDSAETFCREKSNPELQTAAVAISSMMSSMNAMNDSCKTSSKVMAVATAALTAYTATCGVLRFKCEKTCTLANEALLKIEAGIVKSATCTPTNPMAAGVCTGIIAKYEATAAKIKASLSEELNTGDVASIAGRTKLCAHDYVALMASASIGILSVAKTFVEAKKCDKDTQTDSSTGTSGSTSIETASVNTGPTPIGTVPVSSSPEVAAGGSYGNTPKVSLSRTGKQQERETASAVAADSPYRAYLPGGEKDPLKGQNVSASTSNVSREITSANGKNNFEKIREKFRSQGNKLLQP